MYHIAMTSFHSLSFTCCLFVIFESPLTPYVWTLGEEESVCVWEGGKGHVLKVVTNPNCRKQPVWRLR